MDKLAYHLFWDLTHIKGAGYDATLVDFVGSEHVAGWIGSEPCEVPEPILFEANFEVTKRSDFPSNDVTWPLMSPRMLDALMTVREFPHRLIPVRLVDRKALGPTRYTPDGSLRPEVTDDRFSAVQLTKHIDVVDWGRSEFVRSRIDPEGVAHFSKLVLVEPQGGFPPLFRLTAYEGMLFVSADGRRALEVAGIRGVTFDPLPGAELEV